MTSQETSTGQPQVTAESLIKPHILPQLDPAYVQFFVDDYNKYGPRSTNPTIEEIRTYPERFRPQCAVDTLGDEGVSDAVVPSQDGASVPIRIYQPDPKKHGPGPYPAHLNFHGGGFVLGDLQNEGQLCLSMREAGVVVVDVNYRHCPEDIWGKGIQDAWAALNWIRDSATSINVNPTSISIGGISAGGHTSFVLQHMARDAGITLKLCMASVPSSTDALAYSDPSESPFPSFHEFAEGPSLPWSRIRWFGLHALPPDKLPELRKLWPDWWFAPLRATNWSGLCDTFIRTAACDPIRDEGEAYAMKLIAGGTKVTVKRYLGCVHTFMYLPFMKQKAEYDQDAIDALRIAHGLR